MDIQAAGLFGPNLAAAAPPPGTDGGAFASVMATAVAVAAPAPSGPALPPPRTHAFPVQAIPASSPAAAEPVPPTSIGSLLAGTAGTLPPPPTMSANPAGLPTAGGPVAGAEDGYSEISNLVGPAVQVQGEAAAQAANRPELTLAVAANPPIESRLAPKGGTKAAPDARELPPQPTETLPEMPAKLVIAEAIEPAPETAAGPLEGVAPHPPGENVEAEPDRGSAPDALMGAVPVVPDAPDRSKPLALSEPRLPAAAVPAAEGRAHATRAAGNEIAPATATPATGFELPTQALAADDGDRPIARPEPPLPTDKVAASAIQPQEGAGRAVPVAHVDRGLPPSAPGSTATAAPASLPIPPAPPARPESQPVLAARPGRLGGEMGVEIARRVSAGVEELVIRLDPAELGRIHIRMALNEQGSLRAVVAADAPAALDLLRQEAVDLGRALDQAGVRTDSDSIRFDRGGAGGEPGSGWQRYAAPDRSARPGDMTAAADADEPAQLTVRGSGRVNLMA